MFELPATWPRLFMDAGAPEVPPRVPRSVVIPFSQRNGSVVGNSVTGLTIEFKNEHPATCPLSLIVMLLKGGESGPPKVPRSCIPFRSSHRNVRTCVPKKGSDTKFKANPTTCPESLTEVARLSFLLSNVPEVYELIALPKDSHVLR